MNLHDWKIVQAFCCGNLSMAGFFKVMELYVKYCEESMRKKRTWTE